MLAAAAAPTTAMQYAAFPDSLIFSSLLIGLAGSAPSGVPHALQIFSPSVIVFEHF
jgi:hypothetical protein